MKISYPSFKLRSVMSMAILVTVFSYAPAQAAPTNSFLPLISGNISVGGTALVSRGPWVGSIESLSYQWRRCTDLVLTTTCIAISGASSNSYVISQTDAGKFLRVSVTALDVSGGTTVLTAPSTLVLSRPLNTSLPRITGTESFGNTLSTSSGTWTTPNAGVYNYKWLRCVSQLESTCSYILSATTNSYSISTSDVGFYIRSEVTVTDITNRLPTSAKSQPTALISSEPRNISLPIIVGDPVSGQMIKYDPGTWVANPTATFTVIWQKCTSASVTSCSVIPNQNIATLNISDSDLNAYFRVQVTGVNNLGGTIKFSPFFGPVVKPIAPTNTKVPTISGIAKEGQFLSIDKGEWTGYPTPVITYSWQRCNESKICSDISGASTSSYALTYEDAGTTVKATVKATNPVGSISQTTNSITGIIGLISPFLVPQVSGIANRGQIIETDPGIWAGTNTTDFLYKWQRCSSTAPISCIDISGAQASKYQITTLDQGKYLRSGVAIRNISQYSYSDLTDRVPLPAVSTKYVKGKPCTVKGKRVTSGTKSLICRNVKGKLVWY
jgi:hypothetical protein